jgi:hypothetical protein
VQRLNGNLQASDVAREPPMNSILVAVRHTHFLKFPSKTNMVMFALFQEWMETKAWTPLVAPTDPKVPTTPSCNSFV